MAKATRSQVPAPAAPAAPVTVGNPASHPDTPPAVQAATPAAHVTLPPGGGFTATPAPAAPTATPGTGTVKYTVVGHPVAAVLRYLGAHGHTAGSASRAIATACGGTLPTGLSVHTIRTQVQRGRRGARGVKGQGGLPSLSPAQLAQLGIAPANS